MTEIRHLPNAPVTEALIDFRVKNPAELDISVFESIKESILEDFPKQEKQEEYTANFKMGGENPVAEAKNKGVRGVFYKSEDEKNIVQFRKDGFTFNRLKPYTKWDHIFQNTQELWTVYNKYANPLKITRIATRYINHINIPIANFSEYMTAPPIIPKGLPSFFNGYLSRIKLKDTSQNITATVTQALEGGTTPEEITLLLDVNASINKIFDIEDSSYWNDLEKLRIVKNQIFFGSLTEKAIQKFL